MAGADAGRDPEPRAFKAGKFEAKKFDDCRTIDVGDVDCMRFWSDHLGVPEAEIAEAVRTVGPNSTAVALKLDAPQDDRASPTPISPP